MTLMMRTVRLQPCECETIPDQLPRGVVCGITRETRLRMKPKIVDHTITLMSNDPEFSRNSRTDFADRTARC